MDINSESAQLNGTTTASCNDGSSAPDVGIVFDWDSFSCLEKSHIEEGYKDGYKEGVVLGRLEGQEVGLKHGFQVGEELGFYRGLVDVWSSAIRVDPSCFSNRVQKNIQQMGELIEKYPIMDPEDESVDEMLEGLRLKFRAVCATLGVKLEYDGYPKSSGGQGIDF